MDTTLASENIEIYRRHMPHWRADHVIYFITWRLHKACRQLSSDERTLVVDAIEHFHKRRYWLLAYVIMDDHVHILVRLASDKPLQTVLHSWKSFTANQLQRRFERIGAVWQDESFDRIVRDTNELQNALQYIAHNPVKRWPDTREYPWLRIFADAETE